MSRRALPTVFALTLASVGCVVQSSTNAADPKPAGDTARPNTDGSPDASADSGDGGEDEKPDRAAAPRAELADCPAKASAGHVIANYCTEDGKLAGQWVPVDLLKVSDDVEVIFHAEGSDTKRHTELSVAVRGEELYLRHVTCGNCRRVLGHGFAGHLSHMSPDQLREMQTQLGLGDDMPTLESAQKWKSFAGDPRGGAALTEIAGQGEGEVAGGGR